MKDYGWNRESLYIQYWDLNNLYGCAMSQKLPVNTFVRIKDTYKFNEDFISKVNRESDEGYQYLEKVHELDSDLPFLPETIIIENVEESVPNLCDKIE